MAIYKIFPEQDDKILKYLDDDVFTELTFGGLSSRGHLETIKISDEFKDILNLKPVHIENSWPHTENEPLITIKNIDGDKFTKKYGVKSRNSDNKLYREKIGLEVSQPLSVGITKTFIWIKSQIDTFEKETLWIYESPDGGKTI